MKKQRNVLQGIQRQGRYLKIVFGVGIVFVALLIAGFAYAAALGRNYALIGGDALNKIGSAQAKHAPATHTPVVHPAVTPTVAVPTPAPPTPTPAPPTPVTQAPVSNPPQQVGGSYADMIREVFGPYGAGAVNVAMCESSMNPHAYNGVLGAAGLFQIIPGTFASTSYAGGSVYDPLTNIKAAHEIFVRDGYSWREWACKP